MLELLWEHEVILHALVHLFEEQSQFCPKCSSIIEGVEVVYDEWGDGFHAPQLLFLKVEPARVTEFVCYMQDYNVGIDIQQEDQCGVHARVEGVGLVLALMPLFLVIVLIWFESICIAPHHSIC